MSATRHASQAKRLRFYRGREAKTRPLRHASDASPRHHGSPDCGSPDLPPSSFPVEGKHIVVLTVDGKVTVDYTEPDPAKRKKGREGRVVSSGTFALQAHDPRSKVWFRNIRVKMLP